MLRRCVVTILFYGDPHGRFENLISVVHRLKPEAVIILGDFGLTSPLETVLAPIINKTEIWFIHGNHDTQTAEQYGFLFNSQLAHRNLHGRVETIAGQQVAGLGGVFRGTIWNPKEGDGQAKWSSSEEYMQSRPSNIRRSAKKYGGLTLKHHSSIYRDDYDSLSEQKADILVTHEAPSCHRMGFEVLDNLAFDLGVKQVFHGHHHEDYNDVIKQNGKEISVSGVALAQCKNELGEQYE
mgnify:CR=1 FL=1